MNYYERTTHYPRRPFVRIRPSPTTSTYEPLNTTNVCDIAIEVGIQSGRSRYRAERRVPYPVGYPGTRTRTYVVPIEGSSFGQTLEYTTHIDYSIKHTVEQTRGNTP